MAETQKEKLMRILECSEAEAEDIIKTDEFIDKQTKRIDTPYDLSPEKEKIAKEFAKTGTRKAPTVYKFDQKKTRKENPTKGTIIAELATFLSENDKISCENVEITNKERQIAFKVGETRFELTLVQKREPKK